jgi:hypothetical protein
MVVTEDGGRWLDYGPIDSTNPYLRDTTGAIVTYAELERRAAGRFASHLELEHLADQAARARRAVGRLRAAIAAAAPDAIVVVGDDQDELHDLSNMPALAVYYGDEVVMGTGTRFADYASSAEARGTRAAFAMDDNHRFPGHSELALHLIGSLLAGGFDVGAIRGVDEPGSAGVGHAFGIVETQLMQTPGAIPLVPLYLNNYWPPNQLPVPRCYDLGVALRAAIESAPNDLRVAVVASGGLSHFATDEELDHRVLGLLREHDEDGLRSLPPHLLNSGSSEIRNWICVGAACRDKPVAWDEYLPVYRTPAGTGVGLGFMVWS